MRVLIDVKVKEMIKHSLEILDSEQLEKLCQGKITLMGKCPLKTEVSHYVEVASNFQCLKGRGYKLGDDMVVTSSWYSASLIFQIRF